MSPKRKPIVHGSETVAVAYLRLSPGERQSGQGEAAAGLEAQRVAIRSWAESMGVTIVDWFQDIDTSRESQPADRDGFLAALESLTGHGAGLLVAQKRDRLGAGTVINAVIEALVRDRGARVVTLDVSLDDSPEAAFLAAMLDAISAYELAKLRARTKAALSVKKHRGERTGSLPLGSRLRADGQHVGRHRDNPRHLETCGGCLNLEADSHERAAIDMARGMVASGMSLRAAASELESAGYVARTGKRYDAYAIARMVDREPAID